MNGNPVNPPRGALRSTMDLDEGLLVCSDAQLMHSKHSVSMGEGDKLSALQSLEGQ